MKDRPDAGKPPAGVASRPDGQPDTRPVQYESDRYDREHSPHHASSVADSTLPPPQSVVNDKYRIDVELGRGGMGAVYRAHHVELLKPVALKWLLPEFASDPDSRQRFGREARAASNIKHDNVVDVYDFGIDTERGVPYIVMELLTGVSLSAHLETRGRLEAREALDIMIPCMRGVAAAHKLGIVHRDLKPENIFLCEGDEPDTWAVKVLDFGVAAALEPRGEDALKPIITRTTSRNIVGTVFYMPAEQLAGGSVDARADIYSLGVILYELLSGKPPYFGQTLNEVTTAILDGNAVPLSAVVPGLDPGLSELVKRAMAPRKADRFADTAEMIQAFQQYLKRQQGRSLRESLSGAGTLARERTERASAAALRSVTSALRPVGLGLARGLQLTAAGIAGSLGILRRAAATISHRIGRWLDLARHTFASAWLATTRTSTRTWALVTSVAVALLGLLVWRALSSQTPEAERLPQVVPEVAAPQVRPRPDEPRPVTELAPEPEQSTSAATDPAGAASDDSKEELQPAAAQDVPTGVDPNVAESTAAEQPATNARPPRRPGPKRPPTTGDTPPKSQEPKPEPADKPPPKAPTKNTRPRINYADPW